MKETLERIKNNSQSLINKYSSPLYVYDFITLEKRCQEMYTFQKKLEDSLKRKVRMHYSTKANSNPYILKAVKDNNLYVDCMSPIELKI